ncbi:hypothetical protein [Streptomyces anthocyanicus]|uniref:hypothetical protein n=1 Tax=Streptomyces anthocyanicus TaxID=68174 RepID=UPI00381A63F6
MPLPGRAARVLRLAGWVEVLGEHAEQLLLTDEVTGPAAPCPRHPAALPGHRPPGAGRPRW